VVPEGIGGVNRSVAAARGSLTAAARGDRANGPTQDDGGTLYAVRDVLDGPKRSCSAQHDKRRVAEPDLSRKGLSNVPNLVFYSSYE
jgi:hypothetical protein